MGLYLIGVGGTGAKCVEGALHLAAAGALPEGDLHVLYVDPDEANGTLGRSMETARGYDRVRTALGGQAGPFPTPVRLADPLRWTPFAEQAKLTLGDLFEYNTLRASSPSGVALFDVLYSERERKADLAVGFRGRPAVGAAVFARTVQFTEPGSVWQALKDGVQADAKGGRTARIVLCGSIFGGTGAAGLPTLGRMLRQEVVGAGGGAIELGCVLALPYFSFSFSDGADDVRADAGAFVPNSKAALQYYHQNEFAGVFDALYTFGEPSMPPVATASVGGKSQRNAAHPAELYGALAVHDFFAHPDGAARDRGLRVAGRANGQITWGDLPFTEPGALGAKMLQLARFAFAYLAVYRPALRDAKKGTLHELPWALDLFDDPSTVTSERVQREADDLAAYCGRYLGWLAEVQSTAGRTSGAPLADLADATVFADRDGRVLAPDQFVVDEFGKLTDRPDAGGASLARLWDYVSSAPRHRGVRDLAAVTRAVYDGCSDQSLYGAS